MTSISERALLVSVNISQWTARKLDKRESAEVARRNSAIDGSIRANKDLLPMAHSLKQVHSVVGSIRNEFYRTTVPWMPDCTSPLAAALAPSGVAFQPVKPRSRTCRITPAST